MFLMGFGVLAVVLAMAFLIQCIREVNVEESDGNDPVRPKLTAPELLNQRESGLQQRQLSDAARRSMDDIEYRAGAY